MTTGIVIVILVVIVALVLNQAKLDLGLAVAGEDVNVVSLLSLDRRGEDLSLLDHEDEVYYVAFSLDGTLAVATAFKGVFLWNLTAPRKEPTILPTPARQLLFSHDSKTLFVGGNRLVIKVWDVETSTQRCTLTGHDGPISDLIMDRPPDPMSASWDGTVRFWRAHSGQ